MAVFFVEDKIIEPLKYPWSVEARNIYPGGVSGKFLTVGPGKDYSDISTAVANTRPGDTVVVYYGEYNDTQIIIDRHVHIIGIPNNVGDLPILNNYVDENVIMYEIDANTIFYDEQRVFYLENLEIVQSNAWHIAISISSGVTISNVTFNVNKCFLNSEINTYPLSFDDLAYPNYIYVTYCTINMGYAHVLRLENAEVYLYLRRVQHDSTWYCYGCTVPPEEFDVVDAPYYDYGYTYGSIYINY